MDIISTFQKQSLALDFLCNRIETEMLDHQFFQVILVSLEQNIYALFDDEIVVVFVV